MRLKCVKSEQGASKMCLAASGADTMRPKCNLQPKEQTGDVQNVLCSLWSGQGASQMRLVASGASKVRFSASGASKVRFSASGAALTPWARMSRSVLRPLAPTGCPSLACNVCDALGQGVPVAFAAFRTDSHRRR